MHFPVVTTLTTPQILIALENAQEPTALLNNDYHVPGKTKQTKQRVHEMKSNERLQHEEAIGSMLYAAFDINFMTLT